MVTLKRDATAGIAVQRRARIAGDLAIDNKTAVIHRGGIEGDRNLVFNGRLQRKERVAKA